MHAHIKCVSIRVSTCKNWHLNLAKQDHLNNNDGETNIMGGLSLGRSKLLLNLWAYTGAGSEMSAAWTEKDEVNILCTFDLN